MFKNSSPKKLLVIIDGFEKNREGGLLKSAINELCEFKHRGYQITVVSKKIFKNSLKKEKLFGFDVYRYNSPAKDSFFYRLYPLFAFLFLPRLIKKLHGKYHFTYAYIHNAFHIFIFKKLKIDIPILYAYHSPMSAEIEIDKKKKKYGIFNNLTGLIGLFLNRIEQKALIQADAVIVHSNYMQSQIFQLHKLDEKIKAKIHIIPLAIDINKYKPTQDRDKIREKLNLPKNKTIILSVRELVARMGLENLIQAAPFILKKYPNILFLIAGRGYLKNRLEYLIKKLKVDKSVTLLGFVPENDLPLYYQTADLFVLPTQALEGFGLSTIEALSSGTPVIGTPIGATPEILGPINPHLLSQDANSKSIAKQLLYWLDRRISEEIRKKCRTYCEINFSQTIVVSKIEKILNNL